MSGRQPFDQDRCVPRVGEVVHLLAEVFTWPENICLSEVPSAISSMFVPDSTFVIGMALLVQSSRVPVSWLDTAAQRIQEVFESKGHKNGLFGISQGRGGNGAAKRIAFAM
jgi:hypothetical protein